MKITSILVSLVSPMENHAANRGEKLLGNASSIKRRPDGRVYVSGQMQRHVLFRAMERLNNQDSAQGETYISNGDGVPADIARDLRSDLGGFLIPSKGDYSGRRTAPLTATPAVSREASEVGRDLLVRLKMSESKEKGNKQALTTNEFSQADDMVMNFHLDVGAVGGRSLFTYENEIHLKTEFEKLIDDAEHRRRITLFLQATGMMTEYANQSRNAVSGEPKQVLIVLDNRLSRKAIRYYNPETSDAEKQNILKELEARDAQYFIGDDSTSEGLSVYEAYQEAFKSLESSILYRPD